MGTLNFIQNRILNPLPRKIWSSPNPSILINDSTLACCLDVADCIPLSDHDKDLASHMLTVWLLLSSQEMRVCILFA